MTDLSYGSVGSPLQNLIVAGHEQTLFSALRMVAEMDADPV
jgi:methionyl-tRNA formyltransferase